MESAADSIFFSPLRAETHFYIVRHGQSEGNAKRIFQGLLDLSLVDEGREQARSAGAWLAAQGVQAVFASPLLRAAETGRIIADACGAPLRFDETLRELDTGVFSGLGFEESRFRYPEAYSGFKWRSWDAVPGSEKADVLYERAMRAWTFLRDGAVALESEHDRLSSGDPVKIVAVSHGGFIQWLLRSTFGCLSWMPLVSTANCGIFELFVDPTEAGPAYVQWRRMNFVASEKIQDETLPVF
jgi:broad specificity phosphatase PhoE